MLLKISLPVPLKTHFDYLSDDTEKVEIGSRVLVPFGKRELVGIVIEIKATVEHSHKLKAILAVLDETALLPKELFHLLNWISHYYHHPLGECFFAAIPKALKAPTSAAFKMTTSWRLIDLNYTPTKNSLKQIAVIARLAKESDGITQSALLKSIPNVQVALKTLAEKKVIEAVEKIKTPALLADQDSPPTLNEEQALAVQTVQATIGFKPFILNGITGSGKTEVYLHLVDQTIREGKQALILVPEISLTPQFIARFQQRLNKPVAVIHSSIAQQTRKQNWLLAREGLVSIVIGTRSAVLTPFKSLGIIIVDEAHDSAYKQQDNLRYHAKHVALFRAKQNKIPIVLGSATPSLESVHFVNTGQYQQLTLKKRAGKATPPAVRLVDSQGTKSAKGISTSLHQAIKAHLNSGNQVLLFLNRRGFAPVLVCQKCDWQASCTSCDAKLIVHKQKNNLQCHHCGYIARLTTECPDCNHTELNTIGAGTEQIATTVSALFPEVPVLRIDRDTTQKVKAFTEMVDTVNKAEPMILVGTQMLAKGHDFHHITLVGVLDADHGLYSVDFRGTEVMAQLITQVTGRAGRGDKKGEVVIQTNQADHPFWQSLLQQGYWQTAQQILKERQQVMMPPFQHLCVIRAETFKAEEGIEFLTEIKVIFTRYLNSSISTMGPVPAIMVRRNGRYRSQLLLRAQTKIQLHNCLDQALPQIEKLPTARKHRWSLDVDPIDLF